MSSNQWMGNENVEHIHSIILSAVKIYDTMQFSGKQVDLENTTLNQVTQT